MIRAVLTGKGDSSSRYFSKIGDIYVPVYAGPTQLATTTFFGSYSFSHVVDSGTDLVVIALACYNANTSSPLPTLITFAGTTMNLISYWHAYSSTSYGVLFAWLRNPASGSNAVIITGGGGIRGACTNWMGSQSVPFRVESETYISATTSVSVAPVSAQNDAVIDVVSLNVTSAWTPSANQSLVYQYIATAPQMGMSKKAGAVSSTVMGWSGASAVGVQLGVAMAGS